VPNEQAPNTRHCLMEGFKQKRKRDMVLLDLKNTWGKNEYKF
jgi:hypothetical protein